MSNLLSSFYSNFIIRNILVLNDKNKVKIAEMLIAMKLPESKLDDIQRQIKECLESPHLYNVYEQDSGVDIDGAILNALMTGKYFDH